MDNPRDHHYYFAHQFIPDIFFQEPHLFLKNLERDGIKFISWLWKECLLDIKSATELSLEGLLTSIEIIDIKTKIGLIQLPKPVGRTEALYVALVYKRNQKKDSQTVPGFTRFFTLELGENLNGETATFLGEWTSDRTHRNFGDISAPTREVFLQEVIKRLSIQNND